MIISVIVCTHNPNAERLRRTISSLSAQTLPSAQWDCLIVDNASSPPLTVDFRGASLTNARIVREPRTGLTHARRRGLSETESPLCVFVDDDNVLAPDYLAQAVAIAEAYPKVGAFGGRSLPDFETVPPDWMREFFDLLALRDLGPTAHVVASDIPVRGYPESAPIGAGMVVRSTAVRPWLQGPESGLSDRRGSELCSGGDNDIVLSVFKSGWSVAYFPQLTLLHLIPASRISPGYLGRLNRGIQKSWMQVLYRHQANPWPHLTFAGATLRKAKAFLSHSAWSSSSAWIRWQGACGHFEGRVLTNVRPS